MDPAVAGAITANGSSAMYPETAVAVFQQSSIVTVLIPVLDADLVVPIFILYKHDVHLRLESSASD